MMETFNLRLSKEVRKKLDDLAKIMRRSRANVIRVLVEDYWKIEKIKK